MSHTWRMQLQETGLRLLALLVPPVCVACGRIEGIRSLELALCKGCRRLLQPTPEAACFGCGRPLGADRLPDGYQCGACRRQPPPFTQLLTGWAYESPLVEVVHALKFGRLSFLGTHIGHSLIRRYALRIADVDMVVPVPLHWRRQVSRGFNQAEEIARPIAKELARPLVRALRRKRATRPQTGLDRDARCQNLRRAFAATRSSQRRLQGCRVLLVDDVVTTRNTLAAATRCLLRSGAGSVICFAGGRTNEPA